MMDASGKAKQTIPTGLFVIRVHLLIRVGIRIKIHERASGLNLQIQLNDPGSLGLFAPSRWRELELATPRSRTDITYLGHRGARPMVLSNTQRMWSGERSDYLM